MMLKTADLYLGTFLILSGFAISLLNLRRIVKKSGSSFSNVLLSENIMLMCIGIAFVSRSMYKLNPGNMEMEDMQERSAEIISLVQSDNTSVNCNFYSVLMSYGPLTVSLVNSFLSLIIDNYMHYRILQNMKHKDEENTVHEIHPETSIARRIEIKKLFIFWKKYFSYIAIAFQWIVPVLTILAMYPMGVKEKTLSDLRSISDSCMVMLDVNNETCTFETNNTNLELRKYISLPANYLEVYEDPNGNNKSEQIDYIIKNIHKIVANLKNNTNYVNINVTSPYLFRKSKTDHKCMQVCFIENKKLLLYMFLLAVVSYFVPITISTIILTKIHVMDVSRPNVKTFVSRELLYNILFWTPVMFDTFLSLILCTYSMNGMRTSLFNVVANIYQAVKNFMNTKYFKDNIVAPV